jgi:hypothetical protein
MKPPIGITIEARITASIQPVPAPRSTYESYAAVHLSHGQ